MRQLLLQVLSWGVLYVHVCKFDFDTLDVNIRRLEQTWFSSSYVKGSSGPRMYEGSETHMNLSGTEHPFRISVSFRVETPRCFRVSCW